MGLMCCLSNGQGHGGLTKTTATCNQFQISSTSIECQVAFILDLMIRISLYVDNV